MAVADVEIARLVGLDRRIEPLHGRLRSLVQIGSPRLARVPPAERRTPGDARSMPLVVGAPPPGPARAACRPAAGTSVALRRRLETAPGAMQNWAPLLALVALCCHPRAAHNTRPRLVPWAPVVDTRSEIHR